MELTVRQKKERRSKLAKTEEILQTVADGGESGKIISAIVTRANLSHAKVLEACEPLIDNGILECRFDGFRTYFITEKGKTFLDWLQKFRDTPEARHLRL